MHYKYPGIDPIKPVCLSVARHHTGYLALFYVQAGVNPKRILLLVQVIMQGELRSLSVSNPVHIYQIKKPPLLIHFD